MAYSPYVIGNPDATTGSGTTFAQQLQTNLNAIMHAVVMGAFESWNMTVTAGTGTVDMPQFITYSNGVYRVRKTITWDTGVGVPTTVLYEFSSNSGSTWDTIKTCTFTYDGNSNITAFTWS